MMSPLHNKLSMLLAMILATNASAFNSSPATSTSIVVHSSSPLFASTVGGFNAKTRRIPRARDVSDQVIQYLERKEIVVKKAYSKAANDIRQLNEELSKIRTKKQDYLRSQAVAADPSTVAATTFSETALRSAGKAFLWRIIAGSITFCTSLQFSGSIPSALSIVGSDFGSKMATMFIGERLMNSSQAGRENGADAASRSLVKALIWRLFAIANSLSMAIFITKDLSIASKIAGSDALCKTGLMFAYERAWAKVEWGKKYEEEYEI